MPKSEKARFYSSDPDNPLIAVGGIVTPAGDVEMAEARNGVIETDNPGWLPWLEYLAELPDHPVTKTPPKPKGE